MIKYIPLDPLVAEIDKRLHQLTDAAFDSMIGRNLIEIKDFLNTLDTLEVKEVDLDESARNYLLHEHVSPLNEIFHQADLKAEMQYHKDIENAFKAGFELGMTVSDKEQK